MYAKIAAMYIHGYCKVAFADNADPLSMASTVANGEFIDVFDHKGGGSHKYIPAERLTLDLGMAAGAGVFSYWRMRDDSYLLRTCKGPVAFWSGNDDDKAEWPA